MIQASKWFCKTSLNDLSQNFDWNMMLRNILVLPINPAVESLEQPSVVFSRKALLKSFAIFKGKHTCWSLFWIKEDLKACNCIKKSVQQKCFAVNIAKFLRTSILTNICERFFLASRFGQKLRRLTIRVTETHLWDNIV